MDQDLLRHSSSRTTSQENKDKIDTRILKIKKKKEEEEAMRIFFYNNTEDRNRKKGRLIMNNLKFRRKYGLHMCVCKRNTLDKTDPEEVIERE